MNDSIKLRTGCVYRPPNASTQDSEDLFKFILDMLDSTKHFVIYGDFNLNDIDWSNLSSSSYVSDEFINVCMRSGATQCVNFPTRGENILDLVLCSDQNLMQKIDRGEPFSLSDHDSIYFTMQPLAKQFKEKVLKPCFSKADYGLINSYLITLEWDRIYANCKTAEDYFKAFTQVIENVVSKFVPMTSTSRKKGAPWFNDKLKNLKRVKQRHWKRYVKHKNIVRYSMYEDSSNVFKSELLKAKCNHEKMLFDNRNRNSKKFYNYVRKQTTVCSEIPCLRSENVLATSELEKANVFSDYFATVFTEDNGIMPDFNVNCENHLSSFSCDVRTMIKIVKKLKLSSAQGPDNIPALFLKNIIANIASPLNIVYNKCLSEGFVPNEWKIAHVVPIYKKGNPQSPSNYRPVSLTPILCKVLERVVRKEMVSYLFDNNIIPKNQHGFLSKKSTVSNLIECLDKWTMNFDRGLQTDIVYLDYSKCFDSVVHSKLLFKISKYGFSGNAYNWIKSFLTDRKQFVKVGNTLSHSQDVLSGVPQGTVLGPLLFLCFSSDINSVVKHSNISMYADDTKIFRTCNNKDECKALQNDINSVSKWASQWQLRLNPDKTKHLRIGKCRYEHVFNLNGVNIIQVNSICDIGVFIQSNLKFSDHCNSIVKKAFFNVRNIFNTFKGHSPEFYVTLFKTYVRPILESSSQVWSPNLQYNIDKLESVQRHFTKRIPGFSDIPYPSRLTVLKLESLESRRIKADLTLYYKLINGRVCINVENSIRPFHSHRGHSKHLYRFYSRTETRKHFWTNRIVSYWNKLTEDIVSAKNVKCFKKKLIATNFEGE